MSKYGPTNRHHVVLQSNGIAHSTHIDGHDYSHSLRSATLELASGQPPLLTVTPLLIDLGDTELEQARIVIRPDVAELLTALGWTPPPETPR